ncbi:hypothetical protein GCM10025865_02780 [Paraoerskovia sediminicola]|uniref:Uncharacterized protein n=1 Tax=Paraoerskovia sediminicola TaxID=1138587 RepID=A0ABM8FYY8_9CELL|nr:hypothetical protein [Paraoerskovia sediminicola]BDZ40979.1 hypothetical protein GCM10025865_02780 [Paraoerskovia sediminicola]
MPFPEAARNDPSHLLVLFHPGPAEVPDGPVDVRAWVGDEGSERLVAAGPHSFAWFPDGIGASRLTTPRLTKALGVWGTGRNWNTVRRLIELTRV